MKYSKNVTIDRSCSSYIFCYFKLKVVSDVTKLLTLIVNFFSNFEYISNISATIIKLYFLLN